MGREPVQDARWRYDGGLHQRVDPEPHQPPPPGVPLGGPGPPSHPPPFLMGGPSRSDGLMKESASADSLPVFCAAPVDEVSSAPELQSLIFNLSVASCGCHSMGPPARHGVLRTCCSCSLPVLSMRLQCGLNPTSGRR
jgi:hypothetical protein